MVIHMHHRVYELYMSPIEAKKLDLMILNMNEDDYHDPSR